MHKVQVQPGFTELEQKIFRVVRRYVTFCARSRVRIAEGLAACLPPELANRADITFRAYAEPWYDSLHRIDSNGKGNRPPRDRRL